MHSIAEYQRLKGVETFLTGQKMGRIQLRQFLGQQRKYYFGAFATGDGIVAYKEPAMDVVFSIKAGR